MALEQGVVFAFSLSDLSCLLKWEIQKNLFLHAFERQSLICIFTDNRRSF